MRRPIFTGQHNQAAPVVLFLHIPKTAGTTLDKIIYHYCKISTYLRDEQNCYQEGIYFFPRGIEPDQYARIFRAAHQCGNEIPDGVARALARDDLTAVAGHFPFGIHRFLTRPFTYITLLRDPIDRVISLYYHERKYDHNHAIHKALQSDGVGLGEFVTKLGYTQANNGQCRMIAGEEPRFGGCERRLLDTAKANLRNHFAVVGLTERFDESVDLLTRKLRWRSSGQRGLPSFSPQLVNKDRPPKESLSPQVRDMIARHNELDLELYEYARLLFEEQLKDQDADSRQNDACDMAGGRRRKRTNST